MRKNFIKIFVLIFLISNLIFSENKKLNGNYGIEDGEVYYINRKLRELMQILLKFLKMVSMQKIRIMFIMKKMFLMKQILKVLNY